MKKPYHFTLCVNHSEASKNANIEMFVLQAWHILY